MTGTENRAMGFWLGTGVLLAGAAAACLLRSRYERRTLSLEETWIASPKIKPLGRIMRSFWRQSRR